MDDKSKPEEIPVMDLSVDLGPFYGFVQRIEAKLRLPTGFLMGLSNEPTDWAFCIQLHALVESALNATIFRAIRRPELHEEIAKLNVRVKVAMARALGAINSDLEKFVIALGGVRNRVAHQVANIPGFSLPGAVSNLKAEVRRDLLGGADTSAADFRLVLLMRATSVLIHLDHGETKFEEEFRTEVDRNLVVWNKALSAAILELLDDAESQDAPQVRQE